MSTAQIQAGLKRFAKGFIAGGLAQVVLVMSTGVTVHNLNDLGTIFAALAAGFITGGLMAIEKMMNWEEPPSV